MVHLPRALREALIDIRADKKISGKSMICRKGTNLS
jgi:hypothetical protein|tara:strand:+ start:1132 stop:1239 length:108 start_codon:yes stop_codon:yes gene_type:complete